jgi:hypothetical protein
VCRPPNLPYSGQHGRVRACVVRCAHKPSGNKVDRKGGIIKHKTHTLLLLCAFIFTLRAAASFAIEPKAPTIFGISKLVVGADSIQVTKDSSLPSGLDLIPGKGGSEDGVKSLAVKVGDFFTVSDRRHVSATYRLLRITSGSALVEEIRSGQFSWHQGAPKRSHDAHSKLRP